MAQVVLTFLSAGALALTLAGCGDSCEADVAAGLDQVSKECSGPNGGKKDYCDCIVAKRELFVIDSHAKECEKKQDFISQKKDPIVNAQQTSCCAWILEVGEFQKNESDRRYQETTGGGPENPEVKCTEYQQGLADLEADSEYPDCKNADTMAQARKFLQDTIDDLTVGGHCSTSMVV